MIGVGLTEGLDDGLFGRFVHFGHKIVMLLTIDLQALQIK